MCVCAHTYALGCLSAHVPSTGLGRPSVCALGMCSNGRAGTARELDEVVQDARPSHRQRHGNYGSSGSGDLSPVQSMAVSGRACGVEEEDECIFVDASAAVCAPPASAGGAARVACIGVLAIVGSLQLISLGGVKHTAARQAGRLGFEFVSVTLLQESLKLVIACACLQSQQMQTMPAPQKGSAAKPSSHVLLFGVPAALYCFETNFQYIILDYLRPCELTILWNFKICATAALLHTFLRRRYSRHQWIAIMVLILGCILPQLATHLSQPPASGYGSASTSPVAPPAGLAEKPPSVDLGVRRNHGPHTMLAPENATLERAASFNLWGWGALLSTKFIGTVLALLGCSVAAAGNVISEWLLKQHAEESIHSKNMKLYSFGVLCNLATLVVKVGPNPASPARGPDGIITGFNAWVWMVVITGASSGLVVSGVLRYLDNIAVVFAHALAMIFVAVVSAELFHQVLTPPFIFGGILVGVAMMSFYAEDVKPWSDVLKAPCSLREDN